jgi:lipoprotein-releasing system permease protein
LNFLFAWRYFKSKKSTNAINIIAWISMIAIMVSTAALIIVLSVFNGFEGLVKNLYSDFYADVKITPAQGKFFTADEAIIKKIKAVKDVRALSFTVEEKAVLVNGDYQTIAVLKGVDKNYNEVSKLSKYIMDGRYDVGTTEAPAIIAGSGIANAVGANPQSPATNLIIYLPNRKAKSFNSLDAMHSFEVIPAGVFAVQQEFDDKYAFTNLDFVQYMLDLEPNQYTGIELSATKPDEANSIKQDLKNIFGKDFIVKTSYEQNQSLFTVMQIEKWVIYGILSLILLVAAFNMIGALTMLVLEKEKDIAVLKAMGASEKRIQRIFLSEGFLLAGVGGVLGMLIAFIICFIQVKFEIIKLQGGTFIIDYYPVTMYAKDFILVSLTVLVISVIASWIPSKKSSRPVLFAEELENKIE